VGRDRGYRQTSNSRGNGSHWEGLAFSLPQKMPVYLININGKVSGLLSLLQKDDDNKD